MGRTSGTPNKITAEVRDKLQNLIDDLIKSLDIHELDTNQKIKMLQLSLQYTLHSLQTFSAGNLIYYFKVFFCISAIYKINHISLFNN